MKWTEERVEILKKLWSEGLSANQIADQLGGVSRNAVIGKVYRLKLSSRGSPITAEVRSTKPRKRPGQPTPVEEPKAESAPNLITLAAPRLVIATVLDEQDEPNTGKSDAQSVTQPIEQPVVQLAEQPVEQSVGDVLISQDEVPPVSRRLKLEELTERTCKWPNGDLLGDSFHFCGTLAEKGPYCRYHRRLAYQPPSVRRRTEKSAATVQDGWKVPVWAY